MRNNRTGTQWDPQAIPGFWSRPGSLRKWAQNCKQKHGECDEEKTKCKKEKSECDEERNKCKAEKTKCEAEKNNCEAERNKNTNKELDDAAKQAGIAHTLAMLDLKTCNENLNKCRQMPTNADKQRYNESVQDLSNKLKKALDQISNAQTKKNETKMKHFDEIQKKDDILEERLQTILTLEGKIQKLTAQTASLSKQNEQLRKQYDEANLQQVYNSVLHGSRTNPAKSKHSTTAASSGPLQRRTQQSSFQQVYNDMLHGSRTNPAKSNHSNTAASSGPLQLRTQQSSNAQHDAISKMSASWFGSTRGGARRRKKATARRCRASQKNRRSK
jgi:chromosome segregation ATPase